MPDDCLMTAWWLPDDCLMTAWWLPDNCLTTAWQLPYHCFLIVFKKSNKTQKTLHTMVLRSLFSTCNSDKLLLKLELSLSKLDILRCHPSETRSSWVLYTWKQIKRIRFEKWEDIQKPQIKWFKFGQ